MCQAALAGVKNPVASHEGASPGFPARPFMRLLDNFPENGVAMGPQPRKPFIGLPTPVWVTLIVVAVVLAVIAVIVAH